MMTKPIIFVYLGANLEYAATYLHVSEHFVEGGLWKQKDPFLLNNMQIISGWVF